MINSHRFSIATLNLFNFTTKISIFIFDNPEIVFFYYKPMHELYNINVIKKTITQ